MAEVIFNKLEKVYSNGFKAVHGIDLKIAEGEFMVIVGPSGCAKSTTLRMLAGLETISGGEVRIGEKIVNNLAPKERGIAMVFQNYALYPHMTVFDNMAFGLKLRKTPKEEIKRRVEEAARILDITHLLDRRPKALSGGQKQRVALGRAIVREPKVFLLDEPLSNLDAKLRAAMRTEITKIHKKIGTTFVYVTHDQVEAMTMATRIVVMKDGIIQQVDTPQNLYDLPVNIFVAGFIGTPQMNFINSTLRKKGDDFYVEFGNVSLKLPKEKIEGTSLPDYADQEVIMGIRPECIYEDPEQGADHADTSFDAYVEVTELMGAEIYLYIVVDEQNLIARVSPRSTARAGDTVKVAVDISRAHIFDKNTERCICH